MSAGASGWDGFAEGLECVARIDICKVWQCACGIVKISADLHAFSGCAEEGTTRPGPFYFSHLGVET